MAAIQEAYKCTIEEFSSSTDGLYPERISGDGTIAVTRREVNLTDFEVRMYQWDIDSLSWTQVGEPIKDQVSGDPLWGIELSANGLVLAVYADGPSYEEHIRFFRFEGGDLQQIGRQGEVYELDTSAWQPKGQIAPEFVGSSKALSFNGSVLASGAKVYQFSSGGWTPMGGPAISSKNRQHNEVYPTVALSPDGRRLALATNRIRSVGGRIRVFEFDGTAWVPLGQVLEPIFDLHGDFWDMAFSGTILTYHSETWTPRKDYMQVFYLRDNKWVEIEDGRWNGHCIPPAAVANESLVSFLSITEEGVSTVYQVACHHTSERIRSQNNWSRFANLVIPLMLLSFLFQRMRKQTPKCHSEVELAELEVTRLN